MTLAGWIDCRAYVRSIEVVALATRLPEAAGIQDQGRGDMRSSPGLLTRPADRRACSCWTPSRSTRWRYMHYAGVQWASRWRFIWPLWSLSRTLPHASTASSRDSTELGGGLVRGDNPRSWRGAPARARAVSESLWSGDSASTRMATSCGGHDSRHFSDSITRSRRSGFFGSFDGNPSN
jgi:hypothetical protein